MLEYNPNQYHTKKGGEIMYALSIRQPWAELIRQRMTWKIGKQPVSRRGKRSEERIASGSPTRVEKDPREALAIHAGD